MAAVVLLILLLVRTMNTPGTVPEDYIAPVYASTWSLLPPVIAIVLALITKVVYSSLFIGVLVGARTNPATHRLLAIGHRRELKGRCCVRRPLLADLGYDDHALGRSGM